MPSSATFVSFVATAIVFCVVPGPNVLYIVPRTLAEGRRAGVASVLGVNTASLVHIGLVHIGLAALGLSALLASSTVAYDVVRYAGAAYLVFLGVRALLRSQAGGDVAAAAPTTSAASAGAAYRQGFLVNLLSPKTGLFFLALLPQFVDSTRGSTGLQALVLVLGLVLLAIGLANDSLYAVGAGALARRLHRHGAWLRTSERVGALVYIALGLGAALAGGRRTP